MKGTYMDTLKQDNIIVIADTNTNIAGDADNNHFDFSETFTNNDVLEVDYTQDSVRNVNDKNRFKMSNFLNTNYLLKKIYNLSDNDIDTMSDSLRKSLLYKIDKDFNYKYIQDDNKISIDCKHNPDLTMNIEMDKKNLEKYEMVNSPKHYNTYSVEVIDMFERIYGPEKTADWCEMTALKYRMRMGTKPENPINQDLDKEQWYLNKAKCLRAKINN